MHIYVERLDHMNDSQKRHMFMGLDADAQRIRFVRIHRHSNENDDEDVQWIELKRIENEDTTRTMETLCINTLHEVLSHFTRAHFHESQIHSQKHDTSAYIASFNYYNLSQQAVKLLDRIFRRHWTASNSLREQFQSRRYMQK